MRLSSVRKAFLDFFQTKDHKVLPSSSVVPFQDPSLLFTTAGMVPFKDYFIGKETPPSPRIATSQKCIRAGGKHNDLEQVGYTARHHTFFEMLGNFSFGDYFKEEAIFYAWEFFTKVLELNPDRLYVTVYHTDVEATTLWKKISGLASERIIPIATLDNFWSAGDTGPCGPCSEIFYDHGPGVAGGLPGSPEEDGDRYMELWNLVFMQYDQRSPEERVALPKPSIDTGIGLERLSAVMQGVQSNFQCDVLQALVSHSAQASNTPIHLPSHRVLADHIRSVAFMIADGLLPSNEGRGYVLRRILRRALRHVNRLDASSSHLQGLMAPLLEEMGAHYPELSRANPLIHSVLGEEEEKFHLLLEKGLGLLGQWCSPGSRVLSGEKAFLLYDTYGFPVDLTVDILKERGMILEEDEFRACMEKQRKQSKESWTGMGDTPETCPWKPLGNQYPETLFCGYDQTVHVATIQDIYHPDKGFSPTASSGETISLVCDATPFYAQGGGQVGDTGWIIGEEGRMEVQDTRRHGPFIIHYGVVREGILRKKEAVTLSVNEKRRASIAAHHSATHLLHHALRAILGDHVTQKGSLVSEEKLRFDFSHPKPLDKDTLLQIEEKINGYIQDNAIVKSELLHREQAFSQGAMALFGEKYGETVRVVSMGPSKELCGGIHVASTATIGRVKLLSQSSVASGIRRIEAVAGEKAWNYFQGLESILESISASTGVAFSQLEERAKDLVLKKHVPSVQWNLSAVAMKKMLHTPGGDILLWEAKCQERVDTLIIKGEMQQLTRESGGIGLVTSLSGDRTICFISLSEGLSKKWKAQDLLRQILGDLGKGGGKDTLAQGSIPAVSHDTLVKKLETVLLERVSD